MRLVKFEDGTYGVRKHWFFGWYFQDLSLIGFEWKQRDKFFRACMGSESEARSMYKRLKRGKYVSYEIIEGARD